MSEKKWLTSDICISGASMLVCLYRRPDSTVFKRVGDVPDNPEEWLEKQRRLVARQILNSTESGWFVGEWDSISRRWKRPSITKDLELTGRILEYSEEPFESLSFEDAYNHLMELCSDQVDRSIAQGLLVGVELD